MARKPSRKSPPKPRNVAAKALREGRFQPRVEENPKAYKRRPRHPEPILSPESDNGEKE